MVTIASKLAAVVVVVVMASACAGSSDPASTEALDAQKVESSPTVQETVQEDEGPAILEEGYPVDPGRYETNLKPGMSLKIRSTSWIVDLDRADVLGLFFNNPDYRADLLVTKISEVFDPSTGKAVAAPKDLLAYFSANPYLKLKGSGKTVVAGTSAAYVDASIASFPKKKLPPCDENVCIPLFPMSVGPVVLTGDEEDFDAVRFIELDRDGDQILVSIIALNEESSFATGAITLDALLPDANKVLKLMTFE